MSDDTEPAMHPLITFEQRPENRVSATENFELTDPLVLKTQRLLRKTKRDANGLASPPAGALHIHTSREAHERAGK